MSVTTPRAAAEHEPATKQKSATTGMPTSWADIDNDDDFGFEMPVQTLSAVDPATPDSDKVSTRPSSAVQSPSTVTKMTITKKAKKQVSLDQSAPIGSSEKSEAAKSFVRAEMLARNLFPSFVEVTVDGAVPYSLKSTAALTIAAEGSLNIQGSSPSNSPIQPDTSRRIVFESLPATPQQLPSAIAATANINVADRSHLGRRRRAIRVIADTLVSNGGKAMAVNDVARVTKWNKSFRPGLGCLFSFIKSLPTFFVYHHGHITLTYEEDIASTMLRTWAETDPQAAELQSMAASNANAAAAASHVSAKLF